MLMGVGVIVNLFVSVGFASSPFSIMPFSHPLKQKQIASAAIIAQIRFVMIYIPFGLASFLMKQRFL